MLEFLANHWFTIVVIALVVIGSLIVAFWTRARTRISGFYAANPKGMTIATIVFVLMALVGCMFVGNKPVMPETQAVAAEREKREAAEKEAKELRDKLAGTPTPGGAAAGSGATGSSTGSGDTGTVKLPKALQALIAAEEAKEKAEADALEAQKALIAAQAAALEAEKRRLAAATQPTLTSVIGSKTGSGAAPAPSFTTVTVEPPNTDFTWIPVEFDHRTQVLRIRTGGSTIWQPVPNVVKVEKGISTKADPALVTKTSPKGEVSVKLDRPAHHQIVDGGREYEQRDSDLSFRLGKHNVKPISATDGTHTGYLKYELVDGTLRGGPGMFVEFEVVAKK